MPEGVYVLQVSNISPTASREQIHQLFGVLGAIEEFRCYPTETHPQYASMNQRLAYIKYEDARAVEVGTHLTNTVFVDRALVCIPSATNFIPDEETALKIGGPAFPGQRQLPPNVTNQIQEIGEGYQMLLTVDPTLAALGLPPYPALPANTDAAKVEEIRRTVYVGNILKGTPGEETMNFFNDHIGEVMYLRMGLGNENLPCDYAYIEFTNQFSVPTALQNNGIEFKGRRLRIQHSRVAIIKPQVKTAAMAAEEVEEAMRSNRQMNPLDVVAPGSTTAHRLNQGLVSGGLRSSPPRSHSRKRSRSRSPRSRSRRSRSRSRDRPRGSSRRSRSRSRSRRDRSRERKRSRSRDRQRSREKDREREKKKEKEKEREKSKSEKSKDRDSRRTRTSRSNSPARRSSRNEDRDRDRRKEKDQREKEKDRGKKSRGEKEEKDGGKEPREKSGKEKEKEASKSKKRSSDEKSGEKETETPVKVEPMEEKPAIAPLGDEQLPRPPANGKEVDEEENALRERLLEKVMAKTGIKDEDDDELRDSKSSKKKSRKSSKRKRKTPDDDKNDGGGKRSKKDAKQRRRTTSSSSSSGSSTAATSASGSESD